MGNIQADFEKYVSILTGTQPTKESIDERTDLFNSLIGEIGRFVASPDELSRQQLTDEQIYNACKRHEDKLKLG